MKISYFFCDFFHFRYASFMHTAHGRYPAEIAVSSSAKNTRYFTYCPFAIYLSARGTVQPAVYFESFMSSERAFCFREVLFSVFSNQFIEFLFHIIPPSAVSPVFVKCIRAVCKDIRYIIVIQRFFIMLLSIWIIADTWNVSLLAHSFITL